MGQGRLINIITIALVIIASDDDVIVSLGTSSNIRGFLLEPIVDMIEEHLDGMRVGAFEDTCEVGLSLPVHYL